MAGGDAGQRLRRRMVRLKQFPSRIGVPGQKANALLLAPVQRLLVTTVGQAVAILDGDDF